ncbi:unnamed protein product [Bursaphelenchus okinawaensis]|uniref:Uncharacterized protein n=1 Tax=Bursaphelenchus okinawaensis TaxID=465554 RepID=A0A811L9G2_9BILA|nr:unnamed protein product [Bursaphelenchus okinawaensis]CAG9118810.1 unnamed protein product [Bursaphelenchus okinawaensis]
MKLNLVLALSSVLVYLEFVECRPINYYGVVKFFHAPFQSSTIEGVFSDKLSPWDLVMAMPNSITLENNTISIDKLLNYAINNIKNQVIYDYWDSYYLRLYGYPFSTLTYNHKPAHESFLSQLTTYLRDSYQRVLMVGVTFFTGSNSEAEFFVWRKDISILEEFLVSRYPNLKNGIIGILKEYDTNGLNFHLFEDSYNAVTSELNWELLELTSNFAKAYLEKVYSPFGLEYLNQLWINFIFLNLL